jgi:LmbE family N-acetylglucosaminyl deacetylase
MKTDAPRSRMLVFSAHVADFCSRSGGTIAKHVQAGTAVRVVALTMGERSESGGLYVDSARPSLDQVRQIRQEEALQAAEVLGIEIRFLDWGDLGFDASPERAKCLAQEIRSYQCSATRCRLTGSRDVGTDRCHPGAAVSHCPWMVCGQRLSR